MDPFEELLKTLTDETLKASLRDEHKKVKQKNGELGADLIEKNKKIGKMAENEQTYTRAIDILNKHKVAPEEIPSILEKLNIQKTAQEDYELVKSALESRTKEFDKANKQLHRLEAEKAVKSVFDKARAEFKDEKNQPVKLAENFIDYDNLYNLNDFKNETVLQEKCKQVLSGAFATQTEVLRQVGLIGVDTHKTPDGTQKITGEALNLKEVYDTHGPEAAIHAARLAQASKH